MWDATGGSGFIDQGVTKYQLLQLADCKKGCGVGVWALSWGPWRKRVWILKCFHPLCHSKCTASLPGLTDRFEARPHHGRYVFLSIYVLLNLFLSLWNRILAERWLADKKENGWEKKGSFQHFIVAWGAVAIPLPLQAQLCFGKTQWCYSLRLACSMLSECLSCLSLPLEFASVECIP